MNKTKIIFVSAFVVIPFTRFNLMMDIFVILPILSRILTERKHFIPKSV